MRLPGCGRQAPPAAGGGRDCGRTEGAVGRQALETAHRWRAKVGRSAHPAVGRQDDRGGVHNLAGRFTVRSCGRVHRWALLVASSVAAWQPASLWPNDRGRAGDRGLASFALIGAQMRQVRCNATGSDKPQSRRAGTLGGIGTHVGARGSMLMEITGASLKRGGACGLPGFLAVITALLRSGMLPCSWRFAPCSRS